MCGSITTRGDGVSISLVLRLVRLSDKARRLKNGLRLYTELEKLGKLYKFEGWQTKELRDREGLKKSSSKDKLSFSSHAVDAAVIAAEVIGYAGDFSVPEFWVFKRPNLRRRSLHLQNPQKGGVRRVHGGTWALGVRKNTVCLWKGGVYRTGGSTKGRLSLHDMSLKAKRVTP